MEQYFYMKRKTRLVFALLAATLLIGCLAPAVNAEESSEKWDVVSPDGSVKAELTLSDAGELTYRVLKNASDVIVESSAMGIHTNLEDFFSGMSFVSAQQTSWNNTYTMPGGKKNTYTDNCNQLELVLHKNRHDLIVYVRAYDDGITYRYYIPGEGAAEIYGEYSEINLPDNTGGWGHEWRNEYEGQYGYVPASNLSSGSFSMPFLASINNNTYWALLTEANVYNADASYCASVLQGSSGQNMKIHFASQQEGNVQATYPFQTPQRVVVVAQTLDQLVNTDLILNANPESKIQDTSWIKPGRAVWSWWGEDYYSNVDTTFSQQKRYVDYAAKMGFEYVTVDAGWADWTDGNIADLCAYADTKDVGIFIWANGTIYLKPEYATPDNRYYAGNYIDQDTGEAVHHIETWASWGVKGIKVDFMMDDSQKKMATYQEIIELCAENHLMVNFHGSTKPGGENRTWPNIITSEGVRGAEHYLDWPPAPTAYHNCTLPFTRNVAGPMDYTPVALSRSNINTTPAHQLALSVVYESGVQHFADSIDIYEAWSGTEYLRVLPASWDETRLLDGFPGDYAVMARRKGDSWYIGAITNEARTVSLPLSFLAQGAYNVYQYGDSSKRRVLHKEQFIASASDTLELELSDQGGCALLISNETVPSLPQDDFVYYEAEDAGNILVGKADIYDCANCSGGKKVGYLGNGEGELTFNNITVESGQGGEYEMKLYFLSEDERWIYCQVNGQEAQQLVLARPSGSFDQVRAFTTTVILSEGTNSIRFFHQDWAPDIDRIGLRPLTSSK